MNATSEEIRILLVDDEPLIRRAVSRLLTRGGYRVICAENSQAACARLEEGHIDVVLTDLGLPDGSGIDVLGAARRLDPTVPVVLITGTGDAAAAQRAIDSGALRCLPKPVEPTMLLGVVEEACRARAAVGGHHFEHVRTGEVDVERVRKSRAFQQALSRMWLAMQPVASLRRRTITAFEALVRSDEPSMASPAQIIPCAEELGRLADVGQMVRRLAAQRVAELPPEIDLLVNIHPADLSDSELYDRAAPLTAVAGRVILEITERAPLEAIDGVQDRITELRRLGYRIAIDDLGAGYGSLSAIALIRPDLVKLDMSLVRNVDSDPLRARIVRSIGSMCRQLGVPWLCEGVETREELRALADAGADLVQGYLLGRPARELTTTATGLDGVSPRRLPPGPSQRIGLAKVANALVRDALNLSAGAHGVELSSVLGSLREVLEQLAE